MSKIICDVCGTSYPETAAQCPICGCVRPGDAIAVSGDTAEQVAPLQTEGYTYTKGGRFSKSNVRKRNRAEQSGKSDSAGKQDEPDRKSKIDTGLLIAAVVLLLAFIAMVIYIVLHFFVPGASVDKDPVVETTTQSATTQTTAEETTLATIPCVDLVVDHDKIQLFEENETWLLEVTAEPLDTTDEITFESSDPTVATVSADGLITAVSDGTAEIIIVCGDAELVCTVVCNIAQETEPVTEPETEPTTVPEVVFELNREDFSLFYVGDSWKVYSGDIDVKDIIWSSGNEKVVTVTDGVVKAVGPGTTKIYGEYNGEKLSCIVHCKFSGQEIRPDESPSETPSTGTSTTTGQYTISHKEVTLRLEVDGYSQFVLTLNDAQGNPVKVTWKSTNSCCKINDNLITGVTTGITKIYTVYQGIEYSCDVYVYLY